MAMADLPVQNFQMLFAEHPLPMFIYDIETLRFLEVNQAAQTKSRPARPNSAS